MKKSKTIDIEEFIDEKEVADVLFKNPIFGASKEGGKSYNLLRNALKKTKTWRCNICNEAKEHLSLVGVYKDALVLHVIRFSDEIRDPGELKLPEAKVTKKEVDMAISLIEQYTSEFSFENSRMFIMIS